MFIHYNDVTNKVTGYTNFIAGGLASFTEPTIEVASFDFLNPPGEYEIQLGVPVHVGRSAEMIAAETAERTKAVEDGVQAHLDAEAQTKGYESILSACSYAAYANTYQVEGQSFIVWRGAVWDYCYAELAKIQAGTRTEPTLDAFLLELPVYTLLV